jgi:hypothetical protein
MLLAGTPAPPGEKAALMARLAKLKDAETDELREKAELQDALVRSVRACLQGALTGH